MCCSLGPDQMLAVSVAMLVCGQELRMSAKQSYKMCCRPSNRCQAWLVLSHEEQATRTPCIGYKVRADAGALNDLRFGLLMAQPHSFHLLCGVRRLCMFTCTGKMYNPISQ